MTSHLFGIKSLMFRNGKLRADAFIGDTAQERVKGIAGKHRVKSSRAIISTS